MSSNRTENYLPYMCNDWNSPLHVATKCNLDLFKEIAKIVTDKNLSNHKLWNQFAQVFSEEVAKYSCVHECWTKATLMHTTV